VDFTLYDASQRKWCNDLELSVLDHCAVLKD
jgi:hypothetical protein